MIEKISPWRNPRNSALNDFKLAANLQSAQKEVCPLTFQDHANASEFVTIDTLLSGQYSVCWDNARSHITREVFPWRTVLLLLRSSEAAEHGRCALPVFPEGFVSACCRYYRRFVGERWESLSPNSGRVRRWFSPAELVRKGTAFWEDVQAAEGSMQIQGVEIS
jgi:hypothetical protein